MNRGARVWVGVEVGNAMVEAEITVWMFKYRYGLFVSDSVLYYFSGEAGPVWNQNCTASTSSSEWRSMQTDSGSVSRSFDTPALATCHVILTKALKRYSRAPHLSFSVNDLGAMLA